MGSKTNTYAMIHQSVEDDIILDRKYVCDQLHTIHTGTWVDLVASGRRNTKDTTRLAAAGLLAQSTQDFSIVRVGDNESIQDIKTTQGVFGQGSKLFLAVHDFEVATNRTNDFTLKVTTLPTSFDLSRKE